MEEHKILQRLLECSFDPSNPHYLKSVVDELKDPSAVPLFSLSDRIIEAKLGNLYKSQKDQILWLNASYLRCEDFLKRDKVPDDIKKSKIPELMKMIGQYSSRALTEPVMFMDFEGNCNMEPKPASMVLYQTMVPDMMGGSSSSTNNGIQGSERLSLNFVHLVVNSMAEEYEADYTDSGSKDGTIKGQSKDQFVVEKLEPVFLPVMDMLACKIKGRHFNDQKVGEVNYFFGLMRQKGWLTKLFCLKSKQFHPAQQFNAFTKKPLPQGFNLQMESLLGSILCPTVLDTALYGQNSVRKIHFENVMKRQQRQISASQQNLRHTLTQLVDQATAFTKDSLLKSGPEVQDSVIKWLAAVLAGNEARSKGANQIHDGGDVQHFIESLEQSNIPMYQNLDSRLQFHLQKAKVEGFSTVGFGNNVLWLLFQLMLPLKVCMQDKVDSSVFGIDTSKANSSSSSTDAEAKQSVSDSVVQEAAILLGGFSDLTKMGDEDEVTTARSQLTIPKPSSPNAAAYNFPTKVFALTLKAIHTILVPTIKESLCYYQGFAHFLHKGTAESIQKTDACFGEFLAIQTIFDHEGWVSGLVHTLNWVVLFLLGCAYPEERKQIPKLPNYPEDLPKCRPVDAYKNIVIPPPGGVSSQWAVLPADLVSDLVEILEYFWNIVPPKHPLHSVYQRVDVDGLLLLLVFFLGSGDHVKNPSVRGKITKILQDLCKNPRFSSRMQEYKPIVKNIVSCMIYVFVAVEKTKQSYYDIRMQLKYQLRVPIMELFEELILRQETEHKENLREFATGTGELGSDDTAQEFAKFLNLLMNDATMQLDEGMDTLVAIRKRQAKKALEGGGSGGASSSAGNGNNANGTESDDHEGGDNDIDDEINDGTAGVGVDRGGVQEDERGADGQDMYARSRRDPKEHCRTYMKLGGKTIRTLWVCLKCESVCEVMIKKTVVLQQLVTNCLNACLDRLNGPKLQQLKAGKTREGHSINDFKDYNFFPEKLSTMVLEMYVYITRDPSTRDKVLREILADGRSFKPETFQRALNSARKYSFLTADMLSEFSTLVDELKRRHAGGSVENTANTSSNSDSDGLRTLDAVLEEMSKSKDPTVKSLMEEVEDKYLDPVMCNLMEDPVLLPTSQTVCDRSVIERMLLSLEEDPFTRAKLTIKELVAQPELKAKIEKFKQEYRVM